MSGFEVLQEAPLKFGSVLGRLFYTLKERPLLFFGLGALASAPGSILELAGAERAALSINLPAGLLIQGAIAVATFKTLLGQEVSFGEALSSSGGKLGACLGGALCLSCLSALPLILVGVLFSGFSREFAVVAIIFAGLPLMMAILIPRAVMFQACVLEDLGPLESMSRSLELTKGFRWRIFGLFFVVVWLFILAIALVSVIAGLFVGVSGIDAEPATGVSLVFGILSTASLDVLASIIYYDLRSEKEGLSLEALAGVFD